MSIIIDTTNNRDSIERWTEKSNSEDYVQANKSRQPSYINNTAVFDGESHVMTGQISERINTQDCAIFIVCSCPSPGGTHVVYSAYDSGDEANDANYLRIGYVDGQPTAWYGDGAQSQVLQSSSVSDNSNMHVLVFTNESGGEARLYRGNGVLATSDNDLSVEVNTSKLGGYGDDNYSKVYVRSVVTYDEYKDDGERDSIISHLRGRFVQNFGPPVVEDDIVFADSVFENEADVIWNEAFDDVQRRDALTYHVYRSTSDDISTVAEAEANGNLRTSERGINSYHMETLSPGTRYYVQVVVEDDDGEKTAYSRMSMLTQEDESDVSPFATTDGTDFMLQGNVFRWVGTNAYYLNNFENGAGEQHQGEATVDNFFDGAQTAGIRVVRLWANYDGQPQYPGDTAIQPQPGEYNEEGLRAMDRVVAKAKEHNIMLMPSFINYWEEHGGIPQYNAWDGHPDPTNEPYDFAYFMNGNGEQWYKDYVEMILERTNTETGVKYKNEPAIFAWDIGNELRNPDKGRGMSNVELAEELRDWYQEIAQFIKSIDPNHMVTTGEEGFDVDQDNSNSDYRRDVYSNTYVLRNGGGGSSFILNTDIPEIDFGQFHWYAGAFGFSTNLNQDVLDDQQAWVRDHIDLCKEAGKPLVLGEYGWQAWDDTEELQAVYNPLWEELENYDIGANGDMLWQYDADGTKCYEYGGTICYPGGRRNTPIYEDFLDHIEAMSGPEDDTAPTVSDGSLSTSNVGVHDMTVSFTEAVDDITSNPTYEVYTSENNDISTVSDAEANGTLRNRRTGVTSIDIDGLDGDTTYYIQVIASDQAGNKTAYNSRSVSTDEDTEAPTVSNSSLSTTGVQGTAFIVQFDPATDNETPAEDLVYSVYTNTSDNLDGVADTKANGTLQASDSDIEQIRINALELDTTYYYNVIVEDQSGNETAYTSNSQTTLDEVVGEMVHEWDSDGVNITNGNEVNGWTDNEQGVTMQETSSATRMLWDDPIVYADDNNAKMYSEGEIDINTEEFMLGIVIDFSRQPNTFAGILRMAPDGGSATDDGGIYIGMDGERGEGWVALGKVSDTVHGGDGYLLHDHNKALIVVRVTGGTAHWELYRDGAEDVGNTSSPPTGVPNCTRISINASLLADGGGGIQAYTGGEEVNAQAIRIWDTPGDETVKDDRIASMRSDYNV